MYIDKDTLIFASFAKNAGNNGCTIFNTAFNYYRLNAIYKSFSVNDLEKSVESARVLNFKGFAITMPFKKDIIKYVNELNPEVQKIGSANTVINNDGILKAYNTDYLAAKEILKNVENQNLFILGDGGFSLSVQYASIELGLDYFIINRKNWIDIKGIKNSIIFNCTPVENIEIDPSNKFIDCIINTNTGKFLSFIQASHQFKLYTGLDFPLKNNFII